jgi:hypothetical protein
MIFPGLSPSQITSAFCKEIAGIATIFLKRRAMAADATIAMQGRYSAAPDEMKPAAP